MMETRLSEREADKTDNYQDITTEDISQAWKEWEQDKKAGDQNNNEEGERKYIWGNRQGDNGVWRHSPVSAAARVEAATDQSRNAHVIRDGAWANHRLRHSWSAESTFVVL